VSTIIQGWSIWREICILNLFFNLGGVLQADKRTLSLSNTEYINSNLQDGDATIMLPDGVLQLHGCAGASHAEVRSRKNHIFGLSDACSENV